MKPFPLQTTPLPPDSPLHAVSTRIDPIRPGYARGMPIPWWGKMALKLCLSALPVGYRTWARLGVFRHGEADRNVDALVQGFAHHLDWYRRLAGAVPEAMAEIGPGDSLGRAVCARAAGVARSWMVDAGDYATRDVGHYREVAARCAQAGAAPPDLAAAADREAVLAACGGRYLTDGLASFARIPSAGVDLITSDSVLEHLPRPQIDGFFAEMHRVLRPGGIASHLVDLLDHLGGGFVHLRFPAWFWEHPRVASAGFYTNRLRAPELVRAAERAGFEVAVPVVYTHPAPPRRVHPDLPPCPPEHLPIAVLGLLLRKPAVDAGGG